MQFEFNSISIVTTTNITDAMKRIDLSENEYLQKNSATSSALPFRVIPFSVLDILN